MTFWDMSGIPAKNYHIKVSRVQALRLGLR